MKTSSVRRLLAAALFMAFSASMALEGGARAATGTPTATNPNAGSSPCVAMAAGTPTAATPAASPAASEAFDLLFIDMMIPHHKSAVAMAQIALVRGEHQEVRSLAQQIISSQQDEIAQMQAWRDAWFPGAATMPMDQMNRTMDSLMGTPSAGAGRVSGMATMMNPAAEAAALCNATGSFDQAFLQMMIPHHQSAVAMAQVALRRAMHPEIKTLAQAIIASQQKEIGQMQGWLTAWHGATPPAA